MTNDAVLLRYCLHAGFIFGWTVLQHLNRLDHMVSLQFLSKTRCPGPSVLSMTMGQVFQYPHIQLTLTHQNTIASFFMLIYFSFRIHTRVSAELHCGLLLLPCDSEQLNLYS